MLPSLQFVLALGIIIGAAKVGGYLSSKLGQPAVAGELLAGVILGPSVLNFLQWPVFTDEQLGVMITHLAELGVLLLLFIAGLELQLIDMAKYGKCCGLVGFLGFVLTIFLGYLLAITFSFDSRQALFIGLMLAPTSIGITAQTLLEFQALKSRVGTALLGAAAIDDTLGVLGVSLFLALYLGGVSDGFASILMILLRMSLFLVIGSAIGFWILPKAARLTEKMPISQGLVAFAFITMLIFAWSAEVLGNMTAIIGAFLAGLFFARSSHKGKIERGFSSIAYGLFVPIFFINVGLSANMRQVPIEGLIFLAGMLVVVVLSKLVGSGIGGRLGGFTTRESWQLGFGMIPRGEVVLIIAAIGISEGLIDSIVFSSVVMLVILTSLITPFILQKVFAPSHESN